LVSKEALPLVRIAEPTVLPPSRKVIIPPPGTGGVLVTVAVSRTVLLTSTVEGDAVNEVDVEYVGGWTVNKAEKLAGAYVLSPL
jgi:hypothetical protein